MGRPRRFRLVRVVLAVSLVGLVLTSAEARGRPPGEPIDAAPLAAVSWPPSTGLLVSEVVTGGASASDEFVEIYNASGSAIDLAGLELVYVTSTGGTVTRKQTWTALSVPSHRHVLLANSSGTYAAGADGTYSGGLSATGGSAVLRVVGGAVVDSLSWGDASSSFVEGTAGAAPPAASSLERKPGGAAGNATGFQRQLRGRGLERFTNCPIPVCRTHALGATNSRYNGNAIGDTSADGHADGCADRDSHGDGNPGANTTV